MTNERAVIGGNNPPVDPMEAIQEQYDNTFLMVANWLDGSPVETEAQMIEVDSLLASIKDAEKDAAAAKEAEYRPHKAAGDKVIARWKPFITDLDRQRKGLTAAVDTFKRKRAAELAEEKRIKEAEARQKMREAEEAAKLAAENDLDAQREAAAKMEAAQGAQRDAKAVQSVKGLRTYTVTEIVDGKTLINWIAQNDKEALMDFMRDYATKAADELPGVRRYQEKRAV